MPFMLPRSTIRPDYSRAEWISDAVIHVFGLLLVLISVPVLVTLAAVLRGDAVSVAAVSVYGACLIAMIFFSALYNMAPRGRFTKLLQRLDHSAIYWKIAGTYTPFALLSGGQGVWLLGGIWGAALAGTGLKLCSIRRFRWLALALYLGMGWAGVALGWPIIQGLPPATLWLMALGGVTYTLGVVFYLWESLPFHYTIWHAFVLLATAVFFAAVCVATFAA